MNWLLPINSVAALAIILTACAAIPATPVPTAAPTLDSTQSNCPVTLPNGKRPPDDATDNGINHGNADGTLYTILRPEGVIDIDKDWGYVDQDGNIDIKWPWFKGTRGKLTVTERRLDAPDVTGQGEVPCCYAETGFQPTGLILPSPGCWEITGAIGGSRLTFVLLVIRHD